eukprot:1160379-Pelagomonas_calceolata.AAC.14
MSNRERGVMAARSFSALMRKPSCALQTCTRWCKHSMTQADCVSLGAVHDHDQPALFLGVHVNMAETSVDLILAQDQGMGNVLSEPQPCFL